MFDGDFLSKEHQKMSEEWQVVEVINQDRQILEIFSTRKEALQYARKIVRKRGSIPFPFGAMDKIGNTYMWERMNYGCRAKRHSIRVKLSEPI
jgi:hypothetical protein